MTIREWAEHYCDERGMFPNDTKAVVDELVVIQGDVMAKRWNENIDTYPQLKVLLSIELDSLAVAYIDHHCPEAWYRALFVKDIS